MLNNGEKSFFSPNQILHVTIYIVPHYLKFLNKMTVHTLLDAVKSNLNNKIVHLYFTLDY